MGLTYQQLSVENLIKFMMGCQALGCYPLDRKSDFGDGEWFGIGDALLADNLRGIPGEDGEITLLCLPCLDLSGWFSTSFITEKKKQIWFWDWDSPSLPYFNLPMSST
jgi:hypothetical protein